MRPCRDLKQILAILSGDCFTGLMKRRHALTLLAASSLPTLPARGFEKQTTHIATNSYPWTTFYGREKEPFPGHSDGLLQQVSQAGFQGYEPCVNKAGELKKMAPFLKKNDLKMRSLYTNSTLHEAAKVERSMEHVLEVARAGKPLGLKIIVTNPAPVKWGGKEAKTDAQLKTQAAALDELGTALAKEGVTLAYHNHDMELHHGAREFHHMLTATSPEVVKFCLDSHWIYRGCGNSELALFDAVTHYHERVVELHLRQSKGGVWQETFSMEGDIDYRRLFEFLNAKSVQPHLVLEQAVEGRSPKTTTAQLAHAASYQALTKR